MAPEPVRVDMSGADGQEEWHDWQNGQVNKLPIGALLRIAAHSLSAHSAPAPTRGAPRQASSPKSGESSASAQVVAGGVSPPPGLPPPPGVPSHGSLLHGTGKCRPCMWFWKSAGCEKGEDCHHCHVCSASELGARRKMLKRRTRLGENKPSRRDFAELQRHDSLHQRACWVEASDCLPAQCGSDQETSIGSDVESMHSGSPPWSVHSRQASASPRPPGVFAGGHSSTSSALPSAACSRQSSPHYHASSTPLGPFGSTAYGPSHWQPGAVKFEQRR